MKASTLRDWDLTGAADVDMLRDGREVRCPECGAWIRLQFADRPGSEDMFRVTGRCRRCGRAEVLGWLVAFVQRVQGSVETRVPAPVAEDRTGQIRLFG